MSSLQHSRTNSTGATLPGQLHTHVASNVVNSSAQFYYMFPSINIIVIIIYSHYHYQHHQPSSIDLLIVVLDIFTTAIVLILIIIITITDAINILF